MKLAYILKFATIALLSLASVGVVGGGFFFTQALNNKKEIDALRIITKTIREKLEEKNKKIEDLDNLLDDQVNRGCKKTLIIRGLEMKEEERTWSDTFTVLANELENTLGWNKEKLKYIITIVNADKLLMNARETDLFNMLDIIKDFISGMSEEEDEETDEEPEELENGNSFLLNG